MGTVQRRLFTPSEAGDCAALRCAEFFAGIGLVRMGLERAGWNVVYANDIDESKARMYEAHFGPEDHFELKDVYRVSAANIPDVEIATASFPCTDLSLAGARRGLNAGAQSSAFWGFVNAVIEMRQRRPPMLLLENVTGFLSSNGGDDFRDAMLALNGMGYSVDPFILDARWYVPQSRVRLFIVCSRLEDPDSTSQALESRIRPKALCEVVAKLPEVRWRFRRLPDPPRGSTLRLRDIIESLPEDAPEWWSEDRVKYLLGQINERHFLETKKLMQSREWEYVTAFRRVRPQADGTKRSMAELRFDGIAGCLRTPKGGSGRQILIRFGRGRTRARLLTPRECSRLMGADEFTISASDNDAYFGFGDAVCVPAIEWIAINYLNPVLQGAAAVASAK